MEDTNRQQLAAPPLLKPTKMELEERCQNEARSYQQRFPSVIPLSSRDLLRNFPHERYQLVDCRTRPERAVSFIAGACPVDELDVSEDDDIVVVCYCTIGYRSGLEARRLKELHPQWTVYNMDGIVAFTHAVQESDSLQLVDETGEKVQRVHTFAATWDFVDPVGYETTCFAANELPRRFLQVGGKILVRTMQSMHYQLVKWCT